MAQFDMEYSEVKFEGRDGFLLLFRGFLLRPALAQNNQGEMHVWKHTRSDLERRGGSGGVSLGWYP